VSHRQRSGCEAATQSRRCGKELEETLGGTVDAGLERRRRGVRMDVAETRSEKRERR
jgi:hypothetical protein